MASNRITLAALRQNARYRADMVGSTFITDAELTVLVNRACAELYDLLVSLGEDFYTTSITSTTPMSGAIALDTLLWSMQGVVANVDQRALKIRRLEYQDGADWVQVRRVNLAEVDRVNNSRLVLTLGREARWYCQVGNTLQLYPTTGTPLIYRLWYVPQWIDLDDVSYTDTDSLQNWTEYVEVRAAIQMLRKEESDTSELMAELASLRARIVESAENRDQGTPPTISDVASPWWP